MHVISLTRLIVFEFLEDTNRDVLEAPLRHEQGCQVCEERGQLDAVRELDPADIFCEPLKELQGCGRQMTVCEVVEHLNFRRWSFESVAIFVELFLHIGIITRVNGYERANKKGDMHHPMALNELDTI